MKEQTERALFWWTMIITLVLFWGAVTYALYPAVAEAQETRQWDVNLAWDANTEADLLDYRLWENGVPVAVILAGVEQTTRVVPAGNYTWYLTARDQSLNESEPSNSVGLTLDEVAPDVSGTTITINISIHVGP